MKLVSRHIISLVLTRGIGEFVGKWGTLLLLLREEGLLATLRILKFDEKTYQERSWYDILYNTAREEGAIGLTMFLIHHYPKLQVPFILFTAVLLWWHGHDTRVFWYVPLATYWNLQNGLLNSIIVRGLTTAYLQRD